MMRLVALLCLWLVLLRPALAVHAQVVDAATGSGIPDATVVVTGQALHTDATGLVQLQAEGGTIF
ncbi:MAG: hypothetical protein PHU07_08650, partial [Acidocella sp.]|nr:hypothetical protein [Acidocella sp.]